tara:strand:- start:217 stop:531 length:315 start_codon:yes stop_codon:yes gene_type:complete
MKYSKAILPFFVLSIFIIILLLYFANITRKIEKENYVLKNQINNIQEQININEIEFSVFNSYEYLLKMQSIYFEKNDNVSFDNRISFNDFKDKDLKNLLKIRIK